MRIDFLVIVLLGSVLVARTLLASDVAYSGGPSVNGSLRVENARLVNQDNKPIQLRGMSTHGLRWYPQYINYSAIMDTKKRGANIFRLAMYSDANSPGGYCESYESSVVSKQLLYIGIENALAADMYVIVDWHLLKDENPLYNADAAEEFFREVTARYPNHPAIIYEICNEPNGETSWLHIKEYAERIIPVITENSPDAVILVGTPQWASDVLAVRDAPLDFPNVMYTYHLYTGMTNYEFYYKLDLMREEGYPVFVSEWGLSTNEETGALDIDQGCAFINYMHKHGISWINWSLSNKDEDFSAIKPEVKKLHGWTEDDLTVSGKLMFQALGGKQE